MIRIDVEDQKRATINLNGVTPFTDEMTFYYDESGNCRKFSLNETGFNNTDALKGDFVLAGVAHEGNQYEIDIHQLYEALDFKEGQKELKFKHLYHNSKDFLSFIGSERAIEFLTWLDNSGLYIHYSALNNLFYSLVDIVDSLWETHPQCIMFFWEIKSALYDFVVEHQNEVIEIFIRNTYPNVEDAALFCDELCSLIMTYNNEDEYYPGFFLELLRQMLKTAGKLDKIVFIQDNEPYLLIQEYYLLYLERCGIFSKSKHIFDEEYEVQKKLSTIQLLEDGKAIDNYTFVKSEKNIYTQISDLVAGLLRKLFMFLDKNSIEDIKYISSILNNSQIENFSIIWLLISKADRKSPLFIKNANTPKNVQERMIKLKILGIENSN